MPTINSGGKVLVTGASGFIAVWVVKTLLERGFYVRGTVRSSSKGDYLKKLFEKHAERFEYVIVEDIQKEGAFDQAVIGVDAVEHTASPYHFKADDPNELISPAVKGTLGILESVLRNGPSVQRIVITSSVAAAIEPTSEQVTLTEKNWNAFSLKEVEAKGRDASNLHKYRTSKTLAEKAAWDFVEKHKESIKWDIATFNPPLVWGPTLHDVPAAASLNTSVADIYAVIKGQKPVTTAPAGNWVDVRDLAQAHVDALTIANAGGQRFLIAGANGPFSWQDFMDAVHTDPSFASLPKGEPGSGKATVHPVTLDTTNVRTVLGLKPKSINETAIDSVKSLLEREKAEGW